MSTTIDRRMPGVARLRSRLARSVIAAALGLPMASSAALLLQVSPFATTFAVGTDFTTMTWSGTGDVTADLSPVDLQLGLGNANTSGCEAADFAGFAVGHIALIQRGACTFGLKAANAEAAGAIGVLIFNQGDTVDASRQGLIGGTLTDLFPVSIPVLFTTYALGESFALSVPGAIVRMAVSVDDPIRPPAPVPEPGTLALLGLGLACAASARRKETTRRIG